MSSDAKRNAQQANLANPVIIVLLGGILLALVVLILLVITGRRIEVHEGNSTVSEVSPTAFKPAKRPDPISDPSRIKVVLKEGATYDVQLKAGLTARAEDKRYAIKTIVNLLYQGEFRILRTIESNDGNRVVERRKFLEMRTVLAESHVQDLKLELGLPGYLALASLELLQPGAGTAAIAAKPLAEAVLKGGAQSYVDGQMQAWGSVDELTGKTVLITYEDGQGVTDVTPVDCELSKEEMQFLYNTCTLADCYILKDVNAKPGDKWTVDAYQLSSMIDPSLRGVPSGKLPIRRKQDESAGGKAIAVLQLLPDVIQLDRSDDKATRIGTLVPEGTLRFNLTDGFIEQADLEGSMTIQQVSKDHLLFEASMRTTPRFEIQYSCTLQ